MPSWLAGLIAALVALLKVPMASYMAYKAGRRLGVEEALRSQKEKDIEAATRARRARHSGKRVHPVQDPRNRDNRS